MELETAKKILRSMSVNHDAQEKQAIETVLAALEKTNLRVEVIDENHQSFDGEIYFKNNNGMYVLWKSLHKEVMTHYLGGEIPDGYEVHHNSKDEEGRWDRSKNNIEDLLLMTKNEHAAIHKKRKLKLTSKKVVCSVCGKNFESMYHGGAHKPFLCGKECKKIWIANQTEERTCVVCGKIFKICKYKNTRCCSKHCGNILGHRHREKTESEND